MKSSRRMGPWCAVRGARRRGGKEERRCRRRGRVDGHGVGEGRYGSSVWMMRRQRGGIRKEEQDGARRGRSVSMTRKTKPGKERVGDGAGGPGRDG